MARRPGGPDPNQRFIQNQRYLPLLPTPQRQVRLQQPLPPPWVRQLPPFMQPRTQPTHFPLPPQVYTGQQQRLVRHQAPPPQLNPGRGGNGRIVFNQPPQVAPPPQREPGNGHIVFNPPPQAVPPPQVDQGPGGNGHIVFNPPPQAVPPPQINPGFGGIG